MSDQSTRTPVRFCPGCGARASAGANFCVACGASLGASRPGGTVGNAPSAIPGVTVLGGFLTVGLVLWFSILRPEGPVRQPLAAKPPAAPAPAGSPEDDPATLPTDHPPIAIPDEVRTFIDDLERKAAASPEDLTVWRQLAQVQFRAGQIDPTYLEGSEAAWRHVLEREPKDLEALRGIGNLYFDRENHAKAIEAYEAYLAIDGEDANVRTDLGTMYLYSGRSADALREYEKVLAAKPGFYQAHFNLGVAHLREGDRDKALASFEAAKTTAPDDGSRERIRAMIERARGEASPTGGGFQERVERNLRAHPIAGPKVVRLEWSSPTEGRVVLENFPMEAMPEFARSKFLDRLRGELGDARRETAVDAAARLDLVDLTSGTVMATVEAP